MYKPPVFTGGYDFLSDKVGIITKKEFHLNSFLHLIKQGEDFIKIVNKCALLDACSIAINDILVPIEGLLLATFESPISYIISIYIDKAIALIHFPCAS